MKKFNELINKQINFLLKQLTKHKQKENESYCQGYADAINDIKFVKEQFEIQNK